MSEKLSCHVVEDLLPLYLDGAQGICHETVDVNALRRRRYPQRWSFRDPW